MIPVSVVSLFLVLSLSTATVIFVLWQMKFRRSPKDTETGKEMKQDFKLKVTQCDIAENRAPVALAPNKAYIACDIPKYRSIPVFSNEAYNVIKTSKVPVLPNAAYSVCNVTQYSTSTKCQEMKSLSETNSNKEGGSVATTQERAESACTKVPAHPYGAYAVPHWKHAVEAEGPGLTKVAIYPNEAYAIPQRKAELSSEVPEQAKVVFTPNEAYGVGDVAPNSRGKEVKKLKCVDGSKSKTTVPFVPRKTKAGAKLGCAKVAVFPNEAYAVCGLSAAAKGREMTQQKNVCHSKGKVTGSIFLKKSSSFPK